jgi:fluoroacetyl-CoA thioesterase
MANIEIGQEYSYCSIVTYQQTAAFMGSGDMPVLATPAMVAMMEHAALMVVSSYLEDDETTVGSMVHINHLRPSAVGAKITICASLIEIAGRKLTFSVKAKDGETVVGEGTHVRYIVNRASFMSKLG